MPYRIRVLGVKDSVVPLEDLNAALQKKNIKAKLEIEESKDEKWTQLIAKHEDDMEIVQIERDSVNEGALAGEELNEYLDEMMDYEPHSAAVWLAEYLKKVKVIYAMQILDGSEVSDGWSVIHCLQSAIWKHVGGILQADLEGFSNEDGFHILWQFSDNAHGSWNMAVLQKKVFNITDSSKWVSFEMDLANKEHRAAFLNGDVPKGVKLL